MIHVGRPSMVPEILRPDSLKRQKAESAVRALVEQEEQLEFERLWGERPVRQALWAMQNGRCCYCERLRDDIRESDIEHFRPKAAIEGKSGYGYWWLAYEWNNLFFSCRMCNQHYKKTKFPVEGKCAATPHSDLNAEKALLIDPCIERPENIIGFDWSHISGEVMPYGIGPESVRGKATIDVCGLDRPEVCEERHGVLGLLKRLVVAMNLALEQGNEKKIEEYQRDIFRETSAKSRIGFIGFRRAFFRANFLGEYVADD